MSEFLFDAEWLDRFKDVYMRLQHTMNYLYSHFGVTPAQAGLLLSLFHSGSQTVTGLSEKLNVTKSNLSTMCKRMEKSGLIKRCRNKNDERRLEISLTEYSEKILKQIFLHMGNSSPAVLSAEDKAAILHGLDLLDRYLTALQGISFEGIENLGKKEGDANL